MDLNLRGKRAVVCGSTQGIGRAAAVELALLGAVVTLVARDEEKLRDTARDLPTPAGQVHDFLVADFNFPDQLKKNIETYVASSDVQILINNTGGPPAGPAVDATPEDFVQAFSNHLLCHHILMQAIVPGMKKSHYGRIINIISTSVKIPIRGLGVSNTIRGAVANWSKTLSAELASFGITVNNILPGSTKTARIETVIQGQASKTGKTMEEIRQKMIEEIPAGRMADAAEIAAVVAFLATPAAGYINGTNIAVDGGRTGAL